MNTVPTPNENVKPPTFRQLCLARLAELEAKRIASLPPGPDDPTACIEPPPELWHYIPPPRVLNPHKTLTSRLTSDPQNVVLDPGTAQAGEPSLDLLPLNGEFTTAEPDFSGYAHRQKDREKRKQIVKMLQSAGEYRKAERISACGQSGWIMQHVTDVQTYRLACRRCGNRLCPTCCRRRGRKVQEQAEACLKARHVARPRLMTLTLANEDRLGPAVRRIWRCMKRLKQRAIWRKNVKGSLIAIEIKHSETGWHPHIHILYEGNFIDQAKLSKQWHQITGNSFIVDVRAADPGAIRYVTKYLTKPIDYSVMSGTSETAEEFITATAEKNLFTFTGAWRKVKLDPFKFDHSQWRQVMSLAELVQSCRAGNVIDRIIAHRCKVEWSDDPP